MLRLLIVVALVMMASSAHAEKRAALIIGNGAYAKVGSLANPARDADAMQSLLKAAAFDSVEIKRDVGLAAMRRALREFSDRVRDADMAAVFFAGHGIEVNGTNYLIPVDATLERDTDVEDETISLDRVMQMLEGAKRLRFVILDACRDNPFVRSMKRTVGSRSIGRGLAEVRVLTADTLIAFAAKAGSTAADGEGSNSPYTTALVKHLATPGLDLRIALGKVRDEVLKTTGNRQEPHYYGSLGGNEVALVAGKTEAQASSSPAALSARPSEAGEAWSMTKDTTSVEALEAFMARFKDTYYADLARLRLTELKKQQVSLAEPPKVPPSPAPTPKPAAVTTAPPFASASPRTIRLSDTFPSSDTSSRAPLDAFVKDLTTLSGGQLKIDLLATGTVVPAFQMLDAVSAGTVDAAWTVPSYWYGRSKAFGILAGTVPGGLNATAFVRWIEGDGLAELNRLMAEVTGRKARSLPCAVIGPGGDWFKRTITSIGDFRGLKFRSVGLPAVIGKEFGAAVMVLPGSEIVPAMDRGIIDGSDWSTPESAITLELPRVSRTLHYPGWGRPVHLFELLINENQWQRLGREAQQAFETACRQNLHRSLARIPESERQALAEVSRNGVTIQAYPRPVLEAIGQASRKVLDAMAKEDPNFARVLGSYNKYR